MLRVVVTLLVIFSFDAGSSLMIVHFVRDVDVYLMDEKSREMAFSRDFDATIKEASRNIRHPNTR